MGIIQQEKNLLLWSFLSITTGALPLSAGRIRILSSSWSSLIGLHSLAEWFEEGGLSWERMPMIHNQAESATSSSTLHRPSSTSARMQSRHGEIGYNLLYPMCRMPGHICGRKQTSMHHRYLTVHGMQATVWIGMG